MRFSCLMYHNLADRPSSAYDITPAMFEEQLRWLSGEGYEVDDFDGLAARLRRLESSGDGDAFPERYVVLSFDDGHSSNLKAAELLQQHGHRATFFCCRDVSTRPEFLDQQGLRQLSTIASVGSHAVSHRDLTKMRLAAAQEELRESKEWLEQVTGQPILWFGAPFGALNGALHREALRLGYELVADSKEWWNRAAQCRASQRVARIMISGAGSPADQQQRFRSAVTMERSYLVTRRLRYEAARMVKGVLPERAIKSVARWKRRILR